jgi:YHS domain-containing protein
VKRFILSAAILVLVAGCSAGDPAPANSKGSPPLSATTQASATVKPINKYCAVEKDNEIDPAVTYLYQGKVIGFCCEDCVPKFKANPEKYMKELK